MPNRALTTARDVWQRGSSASSSPDTPAAIAACATQVQMLLEREVPVLLACDPSPEGVLAAVGISYLAHAREGVLRLASMRDVQPRLGEEVVCVPPDNSDDTVTFAQRVVRGFTARVTASCTKRGAGGCPATCDNACIRRLVYATASDDAQMPEVVHRYLRLGFAEGPRIRQLIAHPHVAAFNEIARFVVGECEHTRQFVRFAHMADGSFAASFSAKANTIPLTASHFAARMRGDRFVLVDPRHQIAAFHEAEQSRCLIVRLDAQLAQELLSRTDVADDELYVRAMWQHFYQGTTTPGRDRSQRGYDLRMHWMPQRFWSNLSELQPQTAHEELSIPARYAGHDALREAAPLAGERGCLKDGVQSVRSSA